MFGGYGDVDEVFWVVVAGGLGWIAGLGWVVGEDGIVEITKVRVFQGVSGSRVTVGGHPIGHRRRWVCLVGWLWRRAWRRAMEGL